MNSRDIIGRVFGITRDPRDGLLFLQEFQSLQPESFAIFYADSETILESSEALFSDLKLLYQLDLFPVILLEEDSFQYLKLFFPVDQIAESYDRQLGFAYDLVLREKPLRQEVLRCIGEKKIPILLWDSDSEELANIVERTQAILHTTKVVYLSLDGPLKEGEFSKPYSLLQWDGESNFFWHRERAPLESLSPNQKEFLFIATQLLPNVQDPKFNLVFTLPHTLLTELFTVKGSGTLVKRKNKILTLFPGDSVNRDKLFQLVEESFGKKLKPHFYNSNYDVLYLEENYRACAWLQKTEYGYLLSKFAVGSIARGAGVGRDIWDHMVLDCNPLIWRSKPDNSINKWYFSITQGLEKDEEWVYYWIGLPRDNISKIVHLLKSLPEDFYPNQQAV